jgi:acyl dehydratase
MDTFNDKLVLAGETISKRLRYTRDEIAQFARMTFDENPLHRDVEAARHAGFPDVIAAGQQTSAIMTGMVATYFSRSDDGIPREMLCLNFNYACKLPVFADADLDVLWRVSTVQWNSKLGGMLVHLDGHASHGEAPSVIGRGTILVKHAG